MKRLFYSLLLSTAVLSITSCGEKADKGNTEADSLRNVIGANMAEMDEMNLFLDAVNTSMDSVVNMEGGILRTSGESPMSKKEQIKQNLEAYKMMLERQRERISILEAKLKDGDAKSKKMLHTIQALKKQIEEKDKTIVELTEELEKRKFDIVTLKSHVDKLNTNVAQLKEEKAEQEKALEAQSESDDLIYRSKAPNRRIVFAISIRLTTNFDKCPSRPLRNYQIRPEDNVRLISKAKYLDR